MSNEQQVKVVTWNVGQYTLPWEYPRPSGIATGYMPEAEKLSRIEIWHHRRRLLRQVLVSEQPDLLFLDEVAQDAAVDPGERYQAEQIVRPIKHGTVAYELSPSMRPDYKVGIAAAMMGIWSCNSWSSQWLIGKSLPPDDSPVIWLGVEAVSSGMRLNTWHISMSRYLEPRSDSLTLLKRMLPPRPAVSPHLIVGNFNETPDGKVVQWLKNVGWRDVWAELHPDEDGYTFPLPQPSLRHEYVFLNPDSPLTPIVARLIGSKHDEAGLYPSPHLGLVVEFKLQSLLFAARMIPDVVLVRAIVVAPPSSDTMLGSS